MSKTADRSDANDAPQDSNSLPAVALAQAALYVGTGVWPLLSMRTFEKVTGPKTDRWLVKTVGVLVAVIGGVLAMVSRRRKMPAEILLLAVGSALGLTAIDCVYVAKKRISPVYLLDAVAEVVLAALWAVAWQQARQSRLDHAHEEPSN